MSEDERAELDAINAVLAAILSAVARFEARQTALERRINGGYLSEPQREGDE